MQKFISKLKLYDASDTLLARFATLCDKGIGDNINLTNTIGDLLDFANTHAVNGNCWQYYMAYFIASDVNAFSLAYERKPKSVSSLIDFAYDDCRNLMELFNYNLSSIKCLENKADILKKFVSTSTQSKKPYANIIATFAQNLASCTNTQSFLDCVINFYSIYGVGELGLNKAFRILDKDSMLIPKSHHASRLLPIASLDPKRLCDLIGYDMQKQKVVENTEAFLSGKKANNVLLYGDMGTGKSSTIKALINEYYEQGLRVIEVYKHQFLYISDIMSKLSTRNYKYILYLDDLSFDDFEVEYKYFKAIIDGGLEAKPDNVLIYATSNRRHIIKENYSDGNDINSSDELHKSDTKNEKLSLVARFGLSIYYPSPDQQQFLNIVHELAKRYNVNMDIVALDRQALTWAIRNGTKSGRMAEQFIHTLL